MIPPLFQTPSSYFTIYIAVRTTNSDEFIITDMQKYNRRYFREN